MEITASTLNLRIPNKRFSLSARRLWEHTEYDQANPFGQLITSSSKAADFIDIIKVIDHVEVLEGRTLAQVKASAANWSPDDVGLVFVFSEVCDQFEAAVQRHLTTCAARLGMRRQHCPFLPPDPSGMAPGDGLGIQNLHSGLRRWLEERSDQKANARQWLATINNLRARGLREEELTRCNLAEVLSTMDDSVSVTAGEVASSCRFGNLRFSVIPVQANARRSLRFDKPPTRELRRTRARKGQAGQARRAVLFDRVLGYRVEEVEHASLWGDDRCWQAVRHDGQVIVDAKGHDSCRTVDEAIALASSDAQLFFPKRLALGRWHRHAWSGGADYREWLVTLPYYPVSYFSDHFDIRNVLLHVRCDFREGPAGERVLLVQELQSDWAQEARHQLRDADEGTRSALLPPFYKDWEALGMKLILLHAAHLKVDLVAWTLGRHQTERFNGYGGAGLAKLYDKTLPQVCEQILAPFKIRCETFEVYLPTNFSVYQAEGGYEVFDDAGVLTPAQN